MEENTQNIHKNGKKRTQNSSFKPKMRLVYQPLINSTYKQWLKISIEMGIEYPLLQNLAGAPLGEPSQLSDEGFGFLQTLEPISVPPRI